jgi:IS5 family transposase
MPVLWMRRASEIAVRKTNKSRGEKDRKGLRKVSAKGRQKDCDAHWAKKNNETHYGYKNHVKVDAKKKLVTK